jgi:hypothetical protein
LFYIYIYIYVCVPFWLVKKKILLVDMIVESQYINLIYYKVILGIVVEDSHKTKIKK